MCFGCWIEFGKPAIVTDATKAAAAAVKALYEINEVGGAMHIVTDDWNLEDSHLKFCGEEIARGEHWSFTETPGSLEAAIAVFDLMNPMSIKERASALALERGYIGDDGKEPPAAPMPLVPFNVMAN